MTKKHWADKVNWSTVLKNSKSKKMREMVFDVMDTIKADNNGNGWMYPNLEKRARAIELRAGMSIFLVPNAKLVETPDEVKKFTMKLDRLVKKLSNCVHLEQGLRAAVMCVVEALAKPGRADAEIKRIIKTISKAAHINEEVLFDALGCRMGEFEKQCKDGGFSNWESDGSVAVECN